MRAAGFTQSLAVGKALARRRQGPYALERTTVRRRTGAAEFARLVEGRAVARTFAVDRVLTKGFAVVRGARRVRRGPDGSPVLLIPGSRSGAVAPDRVRDPVPPPGGSS